MDLKNDYRFGRTRYEDYMVISETTKSTKAKLKTNSGLGKAREQSRSKRCDGHRKQLR